MTQERFEFLVGQEGRQNRVPSRFGYQGFIGVPWDDDEAIDTGIAKASNKNEVVDPDNPLCDE